jgi:hypothetical protein
MHFFYLDETGDTGTDLENVEQPIFVLGGVTVSDKSWRKATDAIQKIITDFFNGAVPDGFELHAHELVANQGPFAERSQEDCNALALALLDLGRPRCFLNGSGFGLQPSGGTRALPFAQSFPASRQVYCDRYSQ